MFRMNLSKWLAAVSVAGILFCFGLGSGDLRAGDCPPYQYAGSEMWGQAVDMVLENDTLFVLMTHGLLLVDVSDPDTMIRLGQYPLLGGRPVQMLRSKGVAYVVRPNPDNGINAVYAYGLSPGGLELLSVVEPPQGLRSIYISGDSLYVLQTNRMLIYNITQAANPQEVYEYNDPSFYPGSMVKQDSVFILSSDKLYIRDARPGNFLQLLSTLEPINDLGPFSVTYTHLRICGPYVVAIEQAINFSFTSGWVQLIDVRNPLQPLRHGNYQIPRLVNDMSWGKNQIYVGSDYGVHSFTVTDDTLFEFKSWFLDPGGAGGIESNDERAFTFTRQSEVSNFSPPNCHDCWCDSTGRDSVYTSDLLTIDLSGTIPCATSNYRLPGIASKAALWGNYLYTAETFRSHEVNLYDVSLPDTIIEMAPVRFSHPVNNIAISGNILWAGANGKALYVYHINGPRSFTFLDSIATVVTFQELYPVDTVLHYLTFIGSYQYRAATLTGNQLFPLFTLPLPEILTSIAVADTFVAIGRNDKALLLSVAELLTPRVVCTLQTPPVARGVTVREERLVLFGSGIGLSTTFYELFPNVCPIAMASLPEFNGHSLVYHGRDLFAAGPRGDLQIWSDFNSAFFKLCDSITPNDPMTKLMPSGDDLIALATSGLVRYRRSPSTDIELDEEETFTDEPSFSAVVSPNPTNARFRVQLRSSAQLNQKIAITVFDVLGRTVAEDVITLREQGQWTWPNEKGGTAVTGVCFIRFQTERESIVKKAVMLK